MPIISYDKSVPTIEEQAIEHTMHIQRGIDEGTFLFSKMLLRRARRPRKLPIRRQYNPPSRLKMVMTVPDRHYVGGAENVEGNRDEENVGLEIRES